MTNQKPVYGTTCPVCGYNGFTQVPEYDDLCPCCFFAFYVNDIDWTCKQLRTDWIADGAKWAWGSKNIPQPPLWSAFSQFRNIGYTPTDAEKKLIAPTESITSDIPPMKKTQAYSVNNQPSSTTYRLFPTKPAWSS